MAQERKPPANTEAEAAVLGAILINPGQAVELAAGILGSDSRTFSDRSHATIYDAIMDMATKHVAIDAVTLMDHLGPRASMIGGATRISEIMGTVPTSANVEYYAQLVMEAYAKRSIAEMAGSLFRQAMSKDTDADGLLDSTEQKLLALSKERHTGEILTPATYMAEAVEHLRVVHETGRPPGLPLGMGDLDKFSGGLCAGELVIVAARPSIGKSAFLLNVAHHLVTRHEKSVLFHSLEMSSGGLALRLAGINKQIDLEKARRGIVTQWTVEQCRRAMDELASMRLYIDDTPMATMWAIRSRARQCQARYGIDVLMVDYLQLIKPTEQNQRSKRHEEVGAICHSLKALAKELGIPVVVACQLSRAADGEANGFNMLPHLRESGDIEQDADQVIVLHRPTKDRLDQLIKTSGDAVAGRVIVATVAKNRDGTQGQAELLFDKPVQRMVPILRAKQQPASQEECVRETQEEREDHPQQQEFGGTDEPFEDDGVPF